jgi:non-ribosomal peptide synthetase component E (peptide arylation enzyme)
VDDAGVPVPDGAEGEIIARGPSQSVGYVDQTETARSFDARGYFHTGDLGYRTSDGAVVITGRKKDLIIRGGENISAREVEDILLRHPKVAEVAVVAMPHARLGETVCACVVARSDAPTLAEIRAYLDKVGIARQKLPERLEIFAEFPMTPAGKIKKDILRAVVASRLREEQGLAPTTMKAPGP